MARHKSASEVTVASMTEASPAHELAKKLALPAAVIAVAITASILFQQYRARETRAVREGDWTRIARVVRIDRSTGFPEADPAKLEEVIPEIEEPFVAAYARLVDLVNRRREGDWDGAEKALAELRSVAGDDPFFATEADYDGDGVQESLLDWLGESIETGRASSEQLETLFHNPPLPEDAPRVRIETTAGDLVVGLYTDRAPKHAANFLKNCEEGVYDGTAFHRVVPGFMIQGGDPNSRSEDVSTWGLGSEDEVKIDPEPNGLLHFSGVLAAAKKGGERESSGTQFYITVAPAHHLDGQHTVFGLLLEGQDVAKKISEAETVEGTERPVEPARILSTTRL